jgi:hypothetical protein
MLIPYFGLTLRYDVTSVDSTSVLHVHMSSKKHNNCTYAYFILTYMNNSQ